MKPSSNTYLLEVRDLTSLPTTSASCSETPKSVSLLHHLNFNLRKGEVLGIVGERGSGKTTLAHTLVRLAEPAQGSIILDGIDILKLKGVEMRAMRCKMQLLFQNSRASLDPRMTVGRIITEPLRVHLICISVEQERKRVQQLLEYVALPSLYIHQYPQDLTREECTRVCIARALAVAPALIIIDETMAELTEIEQTKLHELLVTLQRQFELTYIVTTQDATSVPFSRRLAILSQGSLQIIPV